MEEKTPKMNQLTDATGEVVGHIAATVVAKPDKASQTVVGLFFMLMIGAQVLSAYRDSAAATRLLRLEVQVETYLMLMEQERQRDHDRNRREIDWKRRLSDKVDKLVLAMAPKSGD